MTLPEQRPTLQAVTLPDGSSLAPAQLRSLLLSQGGVLEIGRVLYACDEALENERWRAGGAGFSAQHLLENEGAWSSEDGSLVGPDRDAIAPPRDATVWSLEAPWHAHVDVRSGATDRRGWAYCRSLPNGSEETEGSSGTPFAGAVARRRRWLRVYSRDLAPPRITVHATPVPSPVKRPPPAIFTTVTRRLAERPGRSPTAIKQRENEQRQKAVRRPLRRALGQSDAVQGVARRFCAGTSASTRRPRRRTTRARRASRGFWPTPSACCELNRAGPRKIPKFLKWRRWIASSRSCSVN